MHYKTIIHELLEQRPQVREKLRQSRQLLAATERYAQELKTSHEAWKQMLTQARPRSEPSQIASEALELALKGMQERLPSESADQSTAGQVLEAAMLFLRPPMSRE